MGRTYPKHCGYTSQLVVTGPGALNGVMMTPTASSDVDVKCYDSIEAGNGVIFEAKVHDGETTRLFGFEHTPIFFENGLYVEIGAGQTDTATIVYVNQKVENGE